MRAIVGFAALLAVAAGGCKRVNGAYCDDTRPCASGFACDLVARECHAMSSGGGAGGGGGGAGGGGGGSCVPCGGTTPLCAGGACVACTASSDGEGACAALSPMTPHCAGDGSCVGCRDSNDCSGATPFCDGITHQCRGCVIDGECASRVCDLTPGSQTHGQCIDATKVVYADAVNGDDGNDGLTLATATKTIMKAINIAVGLPAPRPYVRIAAGTYAEGVGVNNATIYLVGETGATIRAPSGKDAFGAQNNGSLTVRNLVATATGGNGGNCTTSATFTAYGTQFIDSSQTGVVAQSTCSSLLLDGCWIDGNMQGGVSVAGRFTIINSIITHNVGGGVNQLAVASPQLFVNDTVADNMSGALNAGVNCTAAGFSVTNSILFDNTTAGTVSESNCPGGSAASDEPARGPMAAVDLSAMTPPAFKASVPLSPDSYHLMATSPCVNKGTSTGAPTHDFDGDPRPDPSSALVDIGADELQ